jgi:membrane-associated phospholipid phosphatase
MTLFFSAYFYLLRHPHAAVTLMPLTALDHAIPLMPQAVWPYLSLWVYVGLPAGLSASLAGAARYGLWAGALCLTGLFFFYWFPTAVPNLGSGVDLTRHPAFAMLQGVDASGNACPSLHVATAVLAAFWMDGVFRSLVAPRGLRALCWGWMLLIVWSTLATKQHVVVDVASGAALGSLFGWLGSRRWAFAQPPRCP